MKTIQSKTYPKGGEAEDDDLQVADDSGSPNANPGVTNTMELSVEEIVGKPTIMGIQLSTTRGQCRSEVPRD